MELNRIHGLKKMSRIF